MKLRSMMVVGVAFSIVCAFLLVRSAAAQKLTKPGGDLTTEQRAAEPAVLWCPIHFAEYRGSGDPAKYQALCDHCRDWARNNVPDYWTFVLLCGQTNDGAQKPMKPGGDLTTGQSAPESAVLWCPIHFEEYRGSGDPAKIKEICDRCMDWARSTMPWADFAAFNLMSCVQTNDGITKRTPVPKELSQVSPVPFAPCYGPFSTWLAHTSDAANLKYVCDYCMDYARAYYDMLCGESSLGKIQAESAMARLQVECAGLPLRGDYHYGTPATPRP